VEYLPRRPRPPRSGTDLLARGAREPDRLRPAGSRHLAQSAADDGQARGRGAAHPPTHEPHRGSGPGHRAAGPGRHRPAGEAGRSVPAPTVRRDAAACAYRRGHRPAPPPAHRRRTDLGPRRDRAEAGPRPPHELRDETGMGILFITHDLAVAGERADEVLVMQSGSVVEAGEAERVFSHPATEYTSRLLADAPALQTKPRRCLAEAAADSQHPFVSVDSLTQVFDRTENQVIGVEDVSFTIGRGTTHGIVGESGSG